MKINVSNTEKINTELDRVNGRATEHTFASIGDIEDGIISVEDRLFQVLGERCNWRGVKVLLRSGAACPGSCEHSRKVTLVNLEYGAHAWYVTDITSTEISGGSHGYTRIVMGQGHKESSWRKIKNENMKGHAENVW